MKIIARQAILMATILLATPLRSSVAIEPDRFTAEERSSMDGELIKLSDQAEKFAGYNQAWDVTFKVLLLVISIVSIGGAGITAAYQNQAVPRGLRILNVVATGLTTALSGFAFSEFNFARRQAVWQRKCDTYSGLRYELQYGDPLKPPFIQKVIDVRKISEEDSNSLPPLAPPAPDRGAPKP